MYGVTSNHQDSVSRDINTLLFNSSFEETVETGDFAKIKELISSSDAFPDENHCNSHVQNEQQTGLMRYRSAPSSFFANVMDNNGCEDFLDLQFPKQEEEETVLIQNKNLNVFGGGNLVRQSSSPAGFLAGLTVDNGFNGIDVGKGSSSTRLNNHINFSNGPSPSSSRFMPQIAESENEMAGMDSPKSEHLGNVNHNEYWNGSALNGLKRSRDGDLKMFSNLNGLDIQNGDSGHYAPGLVHHLSLPKTSSEMAAVEKFLQFQQDAVPCKIRAKRGFATHPRSIAERVRRTRISEKMRKLQDLFPNMEKQTNTADMLDMAVDYIKDLQKEVQTLSEISARCTCQVDRKS